MKADVWVPKNCLMQLLTVIYLLLMCNSLCFSIFLKMFTFFFLFVPWGLVSKHLTVNLPSPFEQARSFFPSDFEHFEMSQFSRCRLKTGRGYDVCQWNDSMMWCTMLLRNLPHSKIPRTKWEEIIQRNSPKGASPFHQSAGLGRKLISG